MVQNNNELYTMSGLLFKDAIRALLSATQKARLVAAVSAIELDAGNEVRKVVKAKCMHNGNGK